MKKKKKEKYIIFCITDLIFSIVQTVRADTYHIINFILVLFLMPKVCN